MSLNLPVSSQNAPNQAELSQLPQLSQANQPLESIDLALKVLKAQESQPDILKSLESINWTDLNEQETFEKFTMIARKIIALEAKGESPKELLSRLELVMANKEKELIVQEEASGSFSNKEILLARSRLQTSMEALKLLSAGLDHQKTNADNEISLKWTPQLHQTSQAMVVKVAETVEQTIVNASQLKKTILDLPIDPKIQMILKKQEKSSPKLTIS